MTVVVLVAVVITCLVLAIGGALTDVGMWYRRLRKPRWNPPNWLFGPAWTVILGLAAWAGVLAWTRAPDPAALWRIGVLYGVNATLHVLWSPLFFKFKRPDWAMIEMPFLWLSILALMIGLAPMAPLAPGLLAPYLGWVSFAIVLNAAIVRLNAPFGARAPARPAKGVGG